jgi:hypothetical protein
MFLIAITKAVKEISAHPVAWWADPATLIAIASAIIALVTAAYTANTARIARKAYDLALIQDARQAPRLVVYLADAYTCAYGSDIMAAVSITVSNRSDVDNSISRAELLVKYHATRAGRATTARVASSDDPAFLPLPSRAIIVVPRSVMAHQTTAGWLVFKFPSWMSDGRIIDGYALTIEDSHEGVTEIPQVYLRQILASPQQEEDNGKKKS